MVRLWSVLVCMCLTTGCSKEHKIDVLDVNAGCHASCEWCVDLEIYCAEKLQAENKHETKEVTIETPEVLIDNSDVYIAE